MAFSELRVISDVNSVPVPYAGCKVRSILMLCSWDRSLSLMTLTDFTKVNGSQFIKASVPAERVRAVEELCGAYGGFTEFLSKGQLVLLKCTLVCSKPLDRYTFQLDSFQVLNNNPMSVFGMSKKMKSKVKLLVSSLSSLGYLQIVKNGDFQGILDILSRKRDSITEDCNENPKKPKIVKSSIPSICSNEAPFVNPLFVPAVNITQSTADSIKFETQFLETQTDTIQPDSGASSLDSDGDCDHDGAQGTSATVQHHVVQVETSNSLEMTPSQKLQLSNSNELVTSPTARNSGEEVIDTDPFAIENIMLHTEFSPEEVYYFPGYIIGIDPFDIELYNHRFQGERTLNSFQLIVSNLHEKHKTSSINRNCLSLRYEGQDVYDFLGVQQGQLSQVGDIRSLMDKLLRMQRRFTFRIARRHKPVHGITLSYWVCLDTLRDILA